MANKEIKINGKPLNINRILVPKTKKRVRDFIEELTPDIDSIIRYAYRNGKKPSENKEELKQWLIGNQKGYHEFNYELYVYFADKCKITI